MIEFEWDPEKAAENVEKHGIYFEDAATAFSDPLSLTIFDPEHSQAEDRYLLLGLTSAERLVVVSHTARSDRIRIISARFVDRRERKDYETGG